LRKVDDVFRLFPNHSKTIEKFEEIGFVTLPYILWKKPTTKPDAFLGRLRIPTDKCLCHLGLRIHLQKGEC
jgi:DNA modification methylase